jgi:4-oxalocrotonate tautomerase
MPYIDVKLFTGRLDGEREQQLIERITNAVVSVFGEEIKEQTWVVLTEVSPMRWGIGGQTSGSHPDVQASSR